MADPSHIPALPAPPDPRAFPQPAPIDLYQGVGYRVDPDSDQASVSLAHYLWILKRRRWRILGFVAVCLVATLIISERITPVFEATATVDVDRQTPAGIVGQEATRTVMNDSDQFLATQVKLIQSDSVLRPVADQYHLREAEEAFESSSPERRVSTAEGPVRLKQLTVARPPNTYLLLISYRSADPRLAADVSNAIAKSYLEHTYNIRIRASASLSTFMEKQLEELRAKMERSGAALAQFERELNVINPEEKTNILSAQLVQLNTEYTNAQAERIRKSAAYESIASGSVEAAQVSTQGEALKTLSERLDEARQKFAEVKVQFGVKHPQYRRAAAEVEELERQVEAARANISQRVSVEYQQAVNREAMLKKAVAESKAEFDRLNARSFEYQALKREAEGDKTLYQELVRKIREAGINAGFQNSSVRIADEARPPLTPVFPNIKLNLLLAFLLSSLVAVCAAVISEVLDKTVRDPEVVARALNVDVVGSLPLVKEWRRRPSAAERGLALVRAESANLAYGSSYGEAIRTLRSSILLSDFDRRLRTLMVTSSAPAEGKSTIAAHLAMAHAEQGRKTLLIDGDLRRPSVHRRFDLANHMGLSDVLNVDTSWREVRTHLPDLPALDILTAGPPSRRAVELMGVRIADVLEQASQEYDLIILDSPPLLGFHEPLQMASAVDGVLLVAVADRTDRAALTSALSTLQRLRANVVGIVANAITEETSDRYYYRYYGSKSYRQEEERAEGRGVCGD
jgi:capsular exopolysaccharide synthesis family protein